jgi:hypothetical protein
VHLKFKYNFTSIVILDSSVGKASRWT